MHALLWLTVLACLPPFLPPCLPASAAAALESVLESKHELTEQELLELLQSFASMGRWFFDNRVLDQLTQELLDRAQKGVVTQGMLESVAECLAGINHKNKALAAHLQKA
jgi:hypothetical protein